MEESLKNKILKYESLSGCLDSSYLEITALQDLQYELRQLVNDEISHNELRSITYQEAYGRVRNWVLAGAIKMKESLKNKILKYESFDDCLESLGVEIAALQDLRYELMRRVYDKVSRNGLRSMKDQEGYDLVRGNVLADEGK